ncbi:MAG: hypothetical protein CVU41_06155 [Chloroflexi bacterium HGW-Chloroflexi-3]|nr:MAG: hypothetical protein CVU41_06155 [Chloroflexi bacterium HGW-Chloroflexi-3]
MELLLLEIPEKYKLDVLIEIYRKSKNITSKNSILFLKYLVKNLNEMQKDQFIKIYSKDLLISKNSSLIRLILSIIEPTMWKGIEKKAKFRIENILIDCIDVGFYNIEEDRTYGKTNSGYDSSLGTWAMNFCIYFDESVKLNGIIHRKCYRIDENTDEVYYVLKWFSKYIFKNINSSYIFNKLITKISEGDQFVEKYVSEYRDELSDEQQKELDGAILKFNEIHGIDLLSDYEIPF